MSKGRGQDIKTGISPLSIAIGMAISTFLFLCFKLTSRLIDGDTVDYDHVSPEIAEILIRTNQTQQTQELTMDIVFWSLGSVLTIAALLVGYNWYSSTVAFDRSKDSMMRDIKNQIDSMIIDERTITSKSISDSNTLERRKLGARFTNINTRMRELHDETIDILNKETDDIELMIRNLDYRFTRFAMQEEFHRFRAYGDTRDAIRKAVEMVELSLSADKPHMVFLDLMLLQAGLESEGAWVTEDDLEYFERVLSNLDTSNAAFAKPLMLQARQVVRRSLTQAKDAETGPRA